MARKGIVLLCIAGLAGVGALYAWPDKALQQPKQEEEGGVIEPLYFFSHNIGSTTPNCPAADGINWEIAIIALSDYMQYGDGAKNGEDMGPAEIQRNFDENCDRNMTIYSEVVRLNPELFP